jgi:hypothetical protein
VSLKFRNYQTFENVLLYHVMSCFVRVAGVLTSVAGAKLSVENMFDGDEMSKFVHCVKIFF